MNAYDFILETEEDALKLYESLAADADQPGIRRIFAMMVDDERQLCAALKAWGRRSRELKDSPGLERLRRAAPAGARSRMQAPHDDLEAYRLVLQMDQERARLYETAATAEPDRDARALLRAAAAQEHRHQEGIESLLDFVSAPRHHLAWREFSNLSEFRNFGREP